MYQVYSVSCGSKKIQLFVPGIVQVPFPLLYHVSRFTVFVLPSICVHNPVSLRYCGCFHLPLMLPEHLYHSHLLCHS